MIFSLYLSSDYFSHKMVVFIYEYLFTNNFVFSFKVFAYGTKKVIESNSDEDLMSGASSSSVVPTDHKATKSVGETISNDIDDDMMSRSKREADFPSFDDIYTFIRRPVSAASLSNELFDELTATETAASDVISNNDVSSNDGDGTDKHGGEASTGMKGIMSELKASKHHKLTRSDIRQLAKKAVILATLKKLKEEKSSKASTSSKPVMKTTVAKVSSKSNKKHNNNNKSNKHNKKKHHADKHSHVSTSDSSSSSSDTSDSNLVPVKDGNEMSEDLSSHSSKKSENDVLTDNDPALTDTSTSDSIAKKSNIGKADDSVANMFDESSDPSKGALSTSTTCLLYTSPSPRDATLSRMPSSA